MASPYVVDPETFLTSHAMRQVELWKQAKENITEAQLHMQRNYNLRAKDHKFKVGSKVWLADYVTKPGEQRKFGYKWKGPYRIANIRSVVAQLVPVNEPGSKIVEAHLNNLKPFFAPYVPLVHTVPQPIEMTQKVEIKSDTIDSMQVEPPTDRTSPVTDELPLDTPTVITDPINQPPPTPLQQPQIIPDPVTKTTFVNPYAKPQTGPRPIHLRTRKIPRT
jgi:hypothetical protein